MSNQKTFWDMSSATFSQALRVGRSLLDSQDGWDQCGPPPARASRSRAQGKDWESETRAIYGRCFDAWLAGADLQFALANRLRQRLDVNGSPEYVLTWRDWDMPLGPPTCALRASARRTSDSDYSGWPTATVRDAGGQSGKASAKKQAELGHPRSILAETVMLTGWATTPANRDYRYPNNESYQERSGTTKGEQLNNQVVHGATPTSSNVETGRPVVLAPEFSRWLMGYPQEPETTGWDSCSPGWQNWVTAQMMLNDYWQTRDETESVACVDTATQ